MPRWRWTADAVAVANLCVKKRACRSVVLESAYPGVLEGLAVAPAFPSQTSIEDVDYFKQTVGYQCGHAG
jgi:hypothetical protein